MAPPKRKPDRLTDDTDYGLAVRRLLSDAIKDCPLNARQIAARMSELTGAPLPPVTTAAPEADLDEIATSLEITKRTAERQATKGCWPYQEQPVKGGQKRLFPLVTLPAPIKSAIIERRMSTSISSDTAQAVSLPVAVLATGVFIPLVPCADLTDAQRLERDARSGVRAAIGRLQASGASQAAAITTLLTGARAGALDPSIDKMLRLARDPRGRAGDGYPSQRTLKRWLTAQDLTPKLPQANMRIPAWAKSFLGLWQVPQKPSVDAAYSVFRDQWPAGVATPSIHQVRRFIAKLGTITREAGRMGPRELKNIQPFIRRDWSDFAPNDAWIADGHCFDAEVQHPLHGRPFRPEITVFIDGGTRRVTGWSLGLSENAYSVADALATGVRRCGLPAIVYGDNGAGYRANLLTDECTGLLARIHATPKFALPYNSQAKGIVERLHRTLWVAAARELPSYIGARMDREARLAQFKLTRKALKNGGSMPLIPWHVFIEFIEAKVADYNAHAHRSLKGISPDGAWAAWIAKGWQAECLNEEELTTLFRPRVTRTIQRAEINLFTNRYFAQALAEFHGMDAQIAYDIHDPQRIWVYTGEGRFICAAECDANKRAAFPVSVRQQANEKRFNGRMKLNRAHRDEILEEFHGAPAINAPSSSQIVLGGRVIDSATLALVERPVAALVDRVEAPAPFIPRSERSIDTNASEWHTIGARLARGEALVAVDSHFHKSWPGSSQGRVYFTRAAGGGLG